MTKQFTGTLLTASITNDDYFHVIKNADGKDYYVKKSNLGISVGGDQPRWQINSWNTPTTNFASIERIILTNGFEWVAWFDSTTVEYLTKNSKVPSNVDNTGNLTIELYVINAVTTSSNYVQYSLEYCARANTETLNAVFTAIDSGDILVSDQTIVSADDYKINRITWTGSISGWTANDNLRLRLKRIGTTGANVPGDSGIIHVGIDIPRS